MKLPAGSGARSPANVLHARRRDSATLAVLGLPTVLTAAATLTICGHSSDTAVIWGRRHSPATDVASNATMKLRGGLIGEGDGQSRSTIG